jgi:hypothetical protein
VRPDRIQTEGGRTEMPERCGLVGRPMTVSITTALGVCCRVEFYGPETLAYSCGQGGSSIMESDFILLWPRLGRFVITSKGRVRTELYHLLLLFVSCL